MSGNVTIDPPEYPLRCGMCEHVLARDEKTYGLWIHAPYDSWGTVVCQACHVKYGDHRNL